MPNKKEKEITVSFTPNQLMLIHNLLNEHRQVRGGDKRGTSFTAWQRVRCALGIERN
jgi:hypothetical protein